MIINAKKCHSITFNYSSKNTPPQNLTLNDNTIQEVEKVKLLGIIISKDLKWKENTALICNKVNRQFYMLYKLKQFGYTEDDLLIAWTTIIRPLTEYATPLWHSGLSETDKRKIESLQKRALAIIFGIQYIDNNRYYMINKETSPYTEALQKLQLPSLQERREILTGKFALQTMKNEKHSDIFQEKQEQEINLRNKLKVKEMHCNTSRYYNSAVPYMSRILNGIKF